MHNDFRAGDTVSFKYHNSQFTGRILERHTNGAFRILIKEGYVIYRWHDQLSLVQADENNPILTAIDYFGAGIGCGCRVVWSVGENEYAAGYVLGFTNKYVKIMMAGKSEDILKLPSELVVVRGENALPY